MEPIILASESPRRRDFFTLLGLPFICVPPHVDESFEPGIDPRSLAEELAIRKVSKVAEMRKDAPLICGADTVISLDGHIYGKAQDRNEAQRMLRTFQGKTHEVISAVALYKNTQLDDKKTEGTGTIDCRSALSTVTFAAMTKAEIEWYLDTNEWQGAAGAYKIQGLVSCFIKSITGSYSSIVGLPLSDFFAMLKDNGYPIVGN